MTSIKRMQGTGGVMLVGMLVLLSACSGPRPLETPPEAPEVLPTPAATLADYEDFDPSPYRDERPAPAEQMRHDVPEKLMEGRAAEGVTATVQGFRIQVFSTLDKSAAVDLEEAAKAWWQAQQDSAQAPVSLFPEELPIYTIYLQPYYRVRVGNFTTRDEAERARAYLIGRFPDAFIVPDQVTITR